MTNRGLLQPAPRRARRAASRALIGGLALVLTAALITSSCSSDDGDAAADRTTTTAAKSEGDGGSTGDGKAEQGKATTVRRPDGPAATVAGELTAGAGVVLGDLGGADLEGAGFVQHEYAIEGTATSYRAEGELPADGTFDLTEGDTADYRTRILVRRPDKADDFNGTVVVEWLNVSGGLDANPDWTFTADEILRNGYAWVGVSAQHIGVEGGPVAVGVPAAGDLAGKGLKATDPERYGSLDHPGDAYSYDIYTQVARMLRSEGAGEVLGELTPVQLLAVGESQSGFMLTTYADGVQPLTRQFDGFLIHSRGGAAAPLGEPGKGIDITGTIVGDATRVRTDLDVPVLILETESDVLSVLNYKPAEQPDTDGIRVWEIAGTAHADRYLLGAIADLVECGVPVNAGPHHFVVRAALRSLDTWVRTGEAPPKADRLATNDDATEYVRDELGIVEGGIRTPQVDVPVDVLSSEPGPNSAVVCLLLGSTQPLSAEQLAARYDSRDAYTSEYEAAADAAIDAGFVLPEDREALLADADPERITG